jgi:hypothetical protein
MTNNENTYIGMSLPEGIRYITVFEKGDFENCGRILRTFYRTEDRVRKLLALGNLLHLGGSLSSNENKTSCWPLNNGNPIHEAKEISGKEKFFLLGDWTYLYENGRWFLGYEGKIYEISNPEFSVFVPDKDHTPSPLDKGLSFAVIGETGKLEFTPEIVNGWDTWKSLPKRVSEKGKTVYVFRKTQLIKVIKRKYSINSLVYWVTYVHNVVYSFYRSMIYCYINSTQRCAGSIVIDIIPTNGADKRKFFPFAPYFPVTNVIKRYFYPYFPAIIGIKGYSFPYFPYLSGIMKIKTALYSLFSRLDWHKTVVFPCLGEIYEGIRSLSWEIPVT